MPTIQYSRQSSDSVDAEILTVLTLALTANAEKNIVNTMIDVYLRFIVSSRFNKL